MEYRFLGDSGLKVSAVSYGNWVTHSAGRGDEAMACIRAALDAGITTFDTADTYANGGAETILGAALIGERRESLEILTKVFGATGPKGPNDSGLSQKHIHESMAQLAVAWVLHNDNVASAITGGSRPEQIKDNAAAGGKSLWPETLAGIDHALAGAVERDASRVGDMSPQSRPT